MFAKPTLSFTITFAIVTLLEMVGDTLSIHWLHYGSKPLIMSLLLLYVWQNYRLTNSPSYIRILLIGMVFALLGDVFLMIREVDLFALGLGSFLLMQVCYSIVFWQSIHKVGHRINVQSLWRTAIPFVLYDIIFLILLRPVFSENPTLTVLWWPVVIYVFCLSLMGLLTTQTNQSESQGLHKGSSSAYRYVVAGALLFILSDSAIAIDKFLHPIAGSTWLIMSTYAAAQYLLVIGILQQAISASPSPASLVD